jgi:YVTN family beta-propeller protein
MKRRCLILVTLLSLLFVLPALAAAIQTYRIKKVGKAPNFIALNQDGSMIYATSFGSNEFIGIDIAQKLVTQRVRVGSGPLGFAIADQGRIALVACRDAGTVSVVDLETFDIIDDIEVGAYPNSVAIGPRGYRAYVSNYGLGLSGRFHIIDLRENSVTATLKMGVSPFEIVVSPVTELVYVVMGGENEVWVVDPDKEAVINKIQVGEAPDGIAITPDGSRIFVSNSRTNDLSVIDAELMRVLVTVPIGKLPFGVAVSPDGKRVFVVNAGSRQVSVLPTDLSSLQGKTFKVDKDPTDIQVGPDNRTVYVVNERSNTIVVADVP